MFVNFSFVLLPLALLTHWDRVTHICISKLTIIGSDNGLSPGRRKAIIWTNAGILLIGPWATDFNEIFIKMKQFSFLKNAFENVVWKTAAIYFGLNVLRVGCFVYNMLQCSLPAAFLKKWGGMKTKLFGGVKYILYSDMANHMVINVLEIFWYKCYCRERIYQIWTLLLWLIYICNHVRFLQ